MNAPDVFIGAGGVFAIAAIKEIVQAFLRNRRENGATKTAGDMDPAYWQNEQRKAMAEVVTTMIVPILSVQTAILSEIRKVIQDQSANMSVMLDRLQR